MFKIFKVFFLMILLLTTNAWGRELGVLIEEADGSPAAYAYKVKVTNGTLSIAGGVATLTVGGTTAYDDIADPDANGSIAFGAYTGTYTSGTDGWGGLTISNTQATITDPAYLLTLSYTDSEGDATGEIRFLQLLANSVNILSVSEDGLVVGNGSAISALDGNDILVSDDLQVLGEVLVAAQTTPAATFYDSDAAGAARADKEAAAISVNMETTTEDGEEGQMNLQVMEGGSEQTYVQLDGKLQTVTIGNASDVTVGFGASPVTGTGTQPLVRAIAVKSGAYTIGTDDINECYGGMIYVTSGATITACDNLASGMNFTTVTVGAIAVVQDVQADDLMYLDGTALSDGEAATNTSTTGDLISCTYYDATGWWCISGSPDGDHWTGP